MGNYNKLVRTRLGGPLRRSAYAEPGGRTVVRIKAIPIAAALLLLLIAQTTMAKYSGGTGEPNDPYRISTPEDLNDIGNHQEDWYKNFVLTNDVNLAQYTGTQFKIIGEYGKPFKGIFDGNDHKIFNFTYTSFRRGSSIGLFECLSGQIKNLCLENVNINAIDDKCVGGLVGSNGGAIINCYSTGNVSGTYQSFGGLVGCNGGTINNCYSMCNVLGDWWVGGIAGWNNGTISVCYSAGDISGDCWSGGLVGVNDGTVSNSYSSANVLGRGYGVGGLVGGTGQPITNCYSVGKVLGGYFVGGLLGYNEGSTITASFWDIETSGQLTCIFHRVSNSVGKGIFDANKVRYA
jgi:hypothetical protein